MASNTPAARRLSTWGATAMVVSQVIGVGIFLTPATMMRTVGGIGPALAVWAGMAVLSIAGALTYAELTTRFPRAGGGYVFVREAFGVRAAFAFGWVSLLVTDPGITAALGIGFAQYLLAAVALPPQFTPIVAMIAIACFGLIAWTGLAASATVLRWTAAAKIAIVGILAVAGLWSIGSAAPTTDAAAPVTSLGMEAIAGAVIGAFFAFGGWWELGRMSEEVERPHHVMPIALVGGLSLVALLYALVSVSFVLVTGANPLAGDDNAFVEQVGAALFGATAGRLLAVMVVIAVSGSLMATMLASPRLYVAMARDGLFPGRVVRFDPTRGSARGATLIQVVLACGLVALGTFDQVLGYFVPVTVFFLGLSAAATLKLPRPSSADVFRAPGHPFPVLLFLLLIAGVLLLFAAGQPRETAIGAAIAALALPLSFVALRPRAV